MSQPIWRGDGEKALVLKTVVSGTAHLIGKNYDRNDLRDGDLGLEFRLDRGRLKQATPEQRSVALEVAKQMYDDLFTTLGGEQRSSMFQPGDVVFVYTGVAMAVHSHYLDYADGFVSVEQPNSNGAWERMSFSLSQYRVTVLNKRYRGRKGVICAGSRRCAPSLKRLLEEFSDDQVFLADFVISAWQAFVASSNSYTTDHIESCVQLTGMVLPWLTDDVQLARVLAAIVSNGVKYKPAVVQAGKKSWFLIEWLSRWSEAMVILPMETEEWRIKECLIDAFNQMAKMADGIVDKVQNPEVLSQIMDDYRLAFSDAIESREKAKRK